MKILIYILLFFSGTLISQSLSPSDVSKYVKTVDSLRLKKNTLVRIKYSEMSRCGGGLSGYYYKDKLVYLHSIYQGELGYTEQIVYLKDTTIYKLSYRQYLPEWEKYEKKYPNNSEDIDAKKMTYSDTLYTISFSNRIKVNRTSKNKYIDSKIDETLLKRRIECTKEMIVELSKQKTENNNQ